MTSTNTELGLPVIKSFFFVHNNIVNFELYKYILIIQYYCFLKTVFIDHTRGFIILSYLTIEILANFLLLRMLLIPLLVLYYSNPFYACYILEVLYFHHHYVLLGIL
jgi:hypothetical protein